MLWECVESARLPNFSSSSGVRLTCALRSGTFGRIVEVGKGLEMTVKEQQEQGQVKHEKGEGEMTER